MRTLRFVLFVWLMTAATSALHAAQYYIYKIEGSVERLAGNQWKPATKDEKIALQDKFALKPGAMLAIGDKDTRRVYVTREAGVQNVAQIIQAARDQSGQTTKLALQKAMEASGKSAPRSVIMGVSYRAGTSEKELANDINMRTYASVFQYVKKPKSVKNPPVSLTCVNEDGYFYFKVENHTGQLLYFNILTIPQGNEQPYLCLDTSDVTSGDIPAVAPQSAITLTQYPFIDEDTSCQYLLFASQEPFDAQVINSLIKQHSLPAKGTKPQPLLFYLHSQP